VYAKAGYRQRKQRQRENQRTSIIPMINPNDNNGPRDLAIRRNGDANPVRVGVSFLSCRAAPCNLDGLSKSSCQHILFLLIHLFFILLFLQLPSIPPQVLESTPSAPTASAPTLAATNGGAIVDLTNPNEFLQHLLRSSPHVTVNCNMAGSNVTMNTSSTQVLGDTYAGSHTVNNMMERLSVPTAALLFQDAKGRTICLEPCGTQIRFTNYGGKNAIFNLPVGTVQESSGGTTAKLLPNGNIEYSFGVTALVPVSATERKIWCKKCAKGTACDHHQIP
jgi:hypothetical protein